MPDTDGSVAAKRCQAMGGYINHEVWDNRTSSCWREIIKLEDAARNAWLSKKDRKKFRAQSDKAMASIDPKSLELFLQRRKQPNVYSEGIRSAISPMLPKGIEPSSLKKQYLSEYNSNFNSPQRAAYLDDLESKEKLRPFSAPVHSRTDARFPPRTTKCSRGPPHPHLNNGIIDADQEMKAVKARMAELKRQSATFQSQVGPRLSRRTVTHGWTG